MTIARKSGRKDEVRAAIISGKNAPIISEIAWGGGYLFIN